MAGGFAHVCRMACEKVRCLHGQVDHALGCTFVRPPPPLRNIFVSLFYLPSFFTREALESKIPDFGETLCGCGWRSMQEIGSFIAGNLVRRG